MTSSVRVPRVMKVLVKRLPQEGYECEQLEVPQPRGDEVLVRVEKVGLCGSDIMLYRWNKAARSVATLPFTPGHEATGVVVRSGPNANLQVGQRVAIECHASCGQCVQCMDGRRDICHNLGQYGCGMKIMQGAFSEYSVISSQCCYPLKYNISSDAAVMLEPAGVAHNAMVNLDVNGHDVLILGCGPIGLLSANIAKLFDAKRVISVDINEERLALAKDMGADVIINPLKQNLHEVIMKETDGYGIARIAEITGAATMLNTCFSLLRKGGHIVLVGLPKEPLHVENVISDMICKSLTLKTIHGRRIFQTWEDCERLVAEGKIKYEKVISHTFPMSRYEEAFQTLFSGKACKIIIDPST